MEKQYSCYGNCRRCLYQPQISSQLSRQPGVNIGCDDHRHETGTTTPKGMEIAHWIGSLNTNIKGRKDDVFTKRGKGTRVVNFKT